MHYPTSRGVGADQPGMVWLVAFEAELSGGIGVRALINDTRSFCMKITLEDIT